MKQIKTIREQDIDPGAPLVSSDNFAVRKAVRAVVFDKDKRIALLHASREGYHKLPGGGIESGEELNSALEREVLEEIGCRIEIEGEVGEILEFWDQYQEVQTSYCYLAQQTGDIVESSFTEEEKAHGFEVIWAKDINDAISILEQDNPPNYEGRHIKPRDIAFLIAAKRLLATN